MSPEDINWDISRGLSEDVRSLKRIGLILMACLLLAGDQDLCQWHLGGRAPRPRHARKDAAPDAAPGQHQHRGSSPRLGPCCPVLLQRSTTVTLNSTSRQDAPLSCAMPLRCA